MSGLGVIVRRIPGIEKLTGDVKENRSPLEQFYVLALRLPPGEEDFELALDAAKIAISIPDGKALFTALRLYLENALGDQEAGTERAITIWHAVGPRVIPECPPGFVYLSRGYVRLPVGRGKKLDKSRGH